MLDGRMAHPRHFFGATAFPRCNYQLTPNTQYVPTILDISKEVHKLLINLGIHLLRKIINDTDESHQSKDDKEHSKLFAVDRDQIVIFQAQYQYTSHNNTARRRLKQWIVSLILNGITSGQKTHNTPSHKNKTGNQSYMQDPKSNFKLKDSPTTKRKKPEWSEYRRKFVATLTNNGHQHVIKNKFRVTDTNGEPIKYSKYKTDNNLVFSRLDLGLVESILSVIVENNLLSKDLRNTFLDIYEYH